MHGFHWIRHFVVQVLVRETCGMCKVMVEVVLVHVVVVLEVASVQSLRVEVEPHIVDVQRVHFIQRGFLVLESFGDGHGQVSSLQNSHFSLEVLVLASVVVRIPISHSDS